MVAATAQTGTFNWMTWGDHYIDTQLKAIETADKITANISELAGNAEGFAKLKEVKGQLDMISGDALWVPDAYNKEGLIEPFDINELKVSSQLYPFAREFPIWTTPEGYLGYPFGWSPISIYYDPAKVSRRPDSWAGAARPEVQGPRRRREPARGDRRVHGQGGRLRQAVRPDRRPARDRQGLLEKLKPNILKFAQQATDSVNSMVSGEAWLITGNIGNEDRVKDGGGPEIKGYIPKEGTVGWQDAEMIVKGGANKALIMPFLEKAEVGREHRRQLHQPTGDRCSTSRPTRCSSTRARRTGPTATATTRPRTSCRRRC